MKKTIALDFLLVLLLFSIAPIAAQEKQTEHTLKGSSDGKAAKAELSEFEFLQGAWAGTGLGAECDEMWSAVTGDCMLGTFRMVRNDKLVFTEFCMLQKEADGGVFLRLKHFDPGFEGWEKKDEFVSFPLVKVENKKAFFGGLTYALQKDGSLKIWVALKQKDGSIQEGFLHLKRPDKAAKSKAAKSKALKKQGDEK